MMNPELYSFIGALKKPYDLRKLSHLLHELFAESFKTLPVETGSILFPELPFQSVIPIPA